MPLTTLAANLLDLRLEFLNPILAEDLDTRHKRLLEECWRMTFGHPNDLDLGLRARPIARGLDPLLYPLQILLYLFSLHHSLGFYRRFTERATTYNRAIMHEKERGIDTCRSPSTSEDLLPRPSSP